MLSTSTSSLESQHRADIMAKMTRSQMTKRIQEARDKLFKVAFSGLGVVTGAQYKKLIAMVGDLDAMIVKMKQK